MQLIRHTNTPCLRLTEASQQPFPRGGGGVCARTEKLGDTDYVQLYNTPRQETQATKSRKLYVKTISPSLVVSRAHVHAHTDFEGDFLLKCQGCSSIKQPIPMILTPPAYA